MSLLDNLVTKYVKRREIMLNDDFLANQKQKKVKIKPFITISREAGSGGKLIAKQVAEKLRYSFYNKKLIDLISKEAKKRKDLISSLDEKERGIVEDLVYSMFSPDYVDKETYFKHLCRVVLTLARKGNCVILGRGSNFIAGGCGGFHVRIIAPFLVRAGYTAQFEGYTIYEARERMQQFDRERKQFIKDNFSKDPSNANYYDLVVNTTYLDINQAAGVIVEAFKKKYPDWKKYQ